MPAAAAPAKALEPSSEGQSAAVAVPRLAAAKARSDATSTRLLPNRSEICPNSGAVTAYVIENTATDDPAIAVERPKAAASSGSNGEITKSSVPTANIVSQAAANWAVVATKVILIRDLWSAGRVSKPARGQPAGRRQIASYEWKEDAKRPSRTRAGWRTAGLRPKRTIINSSRRQERQLLVNEAPIPMGTSGRRVSKTRWASTRPGCAPRSAGSLDRRSEQSCRAGSRPHRAPGQ